MNVTLLSAQKQTSLRWKKMVSALVLGAAMLTPVLGSQAFAQSAKAPAVLAWGDRDRHDNDRRDNDKNRYDRDRRDNDRRHDDRSRHDRYDHRDNDRGRYDRDRRHDNRRDDRWDRNDRNRSNYGYGYGSGYYGNDYYGSSTSLRGVVLEVNERSGYARVRSDNGRVYTVRANRRELDSLRRGERVSVWGRIQGGTIYADNIRER